MEARNILALFVLLISLTSCEKELDLKYHDIEPLTVIEAELTPDGVRVSLTLTTPMDEPMDTARLTDATVHLADITSGTEYKLAANSEGYYANSTPGIIGHEYRLTVEREGQVYQAEATMYPATEILSLEFNWIDMPYDKVAVFQAKYVEDASHDGDTYWIKLYRNGEIYLWEEVDDRSAIDGTGVFFTMTSRQNTDEEEDDTVLFDGDVMTFSICRISRSMHDYLEALQNESNGPAMFSGPRCVGYFIATSPTSKSIEFHPSEIPVYKN